MFVCINGAWCCVLTQQKYPMYAYGEKERKKSRCLGLGPNGVALLLSCCLALAHFFVCVKYASI
jgi:hypothetical protein